MSRINDCLVGSILVCLLLAGCSSTQTPTTSIAANGENPTNTPIVQTPTPQQVISEPSKETQITIDGQGDDWQGYGDAVRDEEGDQLSSVPDFGETKVFANDQYLYVFVEFYSDGSYKQFYLVFFDTYGNPTQLDLGPDFATVHNHETGESSQIPVGVAESSSGLEIKIPLSVFGERPPTRMNINAYTGTRDGDVVWIDQISYLTEREPGTQEQWSNVDRPGHIFLNDGTRAEYLVRAFIQLPIGILVDADGTLFVSDWTGFHIARRSPEGDWDDLGLWRQEGLFVGRGPTIIRIGPDGLLYFMAHGDIFVYKDGQATPLKGVVGQIDDFVFGASGSLYYTVLENNAFVLRRLDQNGTSSTLATGIPHPGHLAVNSSEQTAYLGYTGRSLVDQIDLSTGEITHFFTQDLDHDQIYFALDLDGDIWIRGRSHLYQVTEDGSTKPFYVDGRSQSDYFEAISGDGFMTFDNDGGLWIAQFGSKISHLTPTGEPDSFTHEYVVRGLTYSTFTGSPDGSFYGYDELTRELWKISDEGETTLLSSFDNPGGAGLAVNSQGELYISLPTGGIFQYTENGLVQISSKLVRHMVFDFDDQLIAISGNQGQPKSIWMIDTDEGDVLISSDIDGQPMGQYADFDLAPCAAGGVYIFDGDSSILHTLALDGTWTQIADLSDQLGSGAFTITASPNGDVYLAIHGPYALYKVTPAGVVSRIATGVSGDPSGMAVSVDGKELYIAESGAIDVIPISTE